MAFLVKDFIFIICFLKVQLYLYLRFFISLFSALNLFQGFSCPVDKLLNLSREFTLAVYFWKAKLEFVSRQRDFPTKLFHPHFIIRILSSAFCHPHFVIRILSSTFCHPPSAIRRHPDLSLQTPRKVACEIS